MTFQQTMWASPISDNTTFLHARIYSKFAPALHALDICSWMALHSSNAVLESTFGYSMGWDEAVNMQCLSPLLGPSGCDASQLSKGHGIICMATRKEFRKRLRHRSNRFKLTYWYPILQNLLRPKRLTGKTATNTTSCTTF